MLERSGRVSGQAIYVPAPCEYTHAGTETELEDDRQL